MVLAAGLGKRLRPITYEIPKPMVPVLDRPVMAHAVGLVRRAGIDEIIANVHYFPQTIKGYFGDSISYREEAELLGTAGGVRNCADFFGDEAFLIISGDALTDFDIARMVETHEAAGAVATLAVKRVDDTREYGVVLHDEAGKISGFQEKPAPADAKSDLGNCGIYIFSPEIFDFFPAASFVDWAQDVFPALLEADAPFYIHQLGDEYWNDIGSLRELQQGTFDALEGRLKLDLEGSEIEAGVRVAGKTTLPDLAGLSGPVWIGRDVEIGSDVRLDGPLAVGDGARIGDGAALKSTIVLPGGEVAAGQLLVGAIVGKRGSLALPPRSAD